jgi:hypothetical protein
VSKRFVFGSKVTNAVKSYKADWMMPWTEDKIQSNHIIFEICCFLFNYIILNFNQGAMCLSQKQGVDQYKNALQKLQYAVWGAQELQRYNQLLSNSMKVPLEFKSSTIEFLVALITGLAYMCIFNIMSEGMKDQISDDNLASLEREISNNFFIVKGIIKSDSTLKKTFGYILSDVIGKYYEFGINCLVRMANNFGKQQEAAKTKGHIGRQVAYLSEAVTLIKCLDKEDSFPDKKALLKTYEPLKQQYEDVKAMNDQVYKAPIPPRDQLNDIKPIEMKVRPLEPKNIRVPPQETEFFNNFASEEMDNVKSSLALFVSNKKQHLEKSMFDLKEEVATLNKNYNVPFLKNCANIGGLISEETKKKLEIIREQGEKGYADQVAKIMKFQDQIEASIKEIDGVFAAQDAKDKQTASMCGGVVVPFASSFADVVKNLNEVNQSYVSYKSIEEKVLADYNAYKKHLTRIANSKVSAQELASNPGLDSFVEANKESLGMLKKLSDGVDTLISVNIKGNMDQIMGLLEDIKIDQLAQKVLMNEKDIQKIYMEINERLGPMGIEFEEKISKVKVPIGKVKDLAQKLKVDNPKISTGDVNDILVAIDFFYVVTV